MLSRSGASCGVFQVLHQPCLALAALAGEGMRGQMRCCTGSLPYILAAGEETLAGVSYFPKDSLLKSG